MLLPLLLLLFGAGPEVVRLSDTRATHIQTDTQAGRAMAAGAVSVLLLRCSSTTAVTAALSVVRNLSNNKQYRSLAARLFLAAAAAAAAGLTTEPKATEDCAPILMIDSHR